jgi:predicted MPP superfamily phosphohydrolase
MSTLRILHCSDVHASADNGDDRAEICAAMIVDATKQHQSTAVDLVIFSGDLAQSGAQEEFELGRELLLEPLAAALDLPAENVVLVPGNHDVDRGKVDEFAEVGYHQLLTDRNAVNGLLDDAGRLRAASARLDPWREFHRKYYGRTQPVEVAPLAFLHSFQVRGMAVGVAALNSAWRACGGAADMRRLLLGDAQVKPAVAALDDCDVRIVVVHHPLDWVAPWDADEARTHFERRRCLVLSGHEHMPDPTSEASVRGQAIYGRAGCLYQTFEYFNGYSLLDLELRDVSVTLRTWWPPPRREFDAATQLAAGGKVTLKWSRDEVSSVRLPAFSRVLDSLASRAQAVSVIADHLPVDSERKDIDDLLVEPRFWPVPYEEIRVVASEEDGPRPARADPLHAVAEGSTVLVCGEPESGVSSALIWLVARSFESVGSHLPIVVQYPRRFHARRFDQALRDAVIQIGGPHDPREDLPPLLVAVDDVTTRHARSLDAFAQFVAAHPDHQFVLGFHGDEEQIVVDAFSRVGVELSRAFLGPFGRKELRQLSKRIVGHDSTEIVEQVSAALFGQQLPRTPFVMTALTAVLASKADASSLNESGLLDSYVGLLLGTDDIADDEATGLDFRRREHLLGFVASLLSVAPSDRLPRLEAEEHLAARFRAMGWGTTLSAGRALDDLIRRRVLIEDGAGVGFRHPALLGLFLGKWMGEDHEFARRVLADPLVHEDAVRHAAGLRRNDATLLKAVGDAARGVMDAVASDVRVEMFDAISDRRGWSNEPGSIEELKRVLSARDADRERESQEERDQRLDDFFEGVDDDSDDGAVPPVLVELSPAVALLSGVLRNSELIDDLELKRTHLEQALHGWSLLAVVLAVREDQTEGLRKRLEEALLDDDGHGDADARESIERIAEALTTYLMVMAVQGTLSTPQLLGVLNDVVNDDEFMTPAAHALLATMAYVRLQGTGWVERLEALYRQHGDNPIIAQIVRSTALRAYQADTTRRSDAASLESLLATAYTEGAAGGKRGRDAARSNAITELRRSRTRSQWRSVGPGFDDLDEEGDSL